MVPGRTPCTCAVVDPGVGTRAARRRRGRSRGPPLRRPGQRPLHAVPRRGRGGGCLRGGAGSGRPRSVHRSTAATCSRPSRPGWPPAATPPSSGPRLPDPVRLRWPAAAAVRDEVHGECLTPIPSGTCITSHARADLISAVPTAQCVGAMVRGRAARVVTHLRGGWPRRAPRAAWAAPGGSRSPCARATRPRTLVIVRGAVAATVGRDTAGCRALAGAREPPLAATLARPDGACYTRRADERGRAHENRRRSPRLAPRAASRLPQRRRASSATGPPTSAAAASSSTPAALPGRHAGEAPHPAPGRRLPLRHDRAGDARGGAGNEAQRGPGHGASSSPTSTLRSATGSRRSSSGSATTSIGRDV